MNKLGIDKLLHFAAVLLITASVGLIAGPAAGIAAGILASLGKEALDLATKDPPIAAVLADLSADTLGIIAAAIILHAAQILI